MRALTSVVVFGLAKNKCILFYYTPKLQDLIWCSGTEASFVFKPTAYPLPKKDLHDPLIQFPGVDHLFKERVIHTIFLPARVK